MRKLLTLLLAILLVSAPAFALDLRTQAADALTSQDINPATITLNGVTQTGAPETTFQNVQTGVLHSISHSANRYTSDTDELFIEPGITQCTQQQCTYQTNSFTTFCELVQGVYECTTTSNGVTTFLYYNRAADEAFYVNFLVADTLNPPASGEAPRIIAEVTPTQGDSPLLVTFNNIVTDDQTVDSVQWVMGDGTVLDVDATEEFSYFYRQSGTHTATIIATDNQGLVSQESFTIVVDGESRPPVSNLPYDNSARFNVSIVAVDFATDADINPSSVTFNGQQFQATPYAVIENVASNVIHEYTNEANGYITDTDEIFLDFQLSSCTGATCDLTSRDAFGEVFQTHCDLNTQFNTYDCSSSNRGVTHFFFYSTQTGNVVIPNFLVSDASQAGNQPPVVTASTTALTGSAPHEVTFTVLASDDVAVERTVIFFGDGSSQELNPTGGQATHTYAGGDFTAIVASWDNTGRVTTQDFTITVSGDRNGNNLPYNPNVVYNVSFVAVDYATDADITSTIEILGNTQQANPYADFQLNSNTVYGVTSASQGYETDVDQAFFDYQLPTCQGNSCDLVSRDLFSNVYETHCDLNVPTNVYDCTTVSHGVESYFFYSPDTNNIVVANFLVSDTTIANDNPAVISIEASETNGIAPIEIEFTNSVTDLDGVNRSMWFFGDDTSAHVDDFDTISHTYTQPGVYEAIFVTWDQNGVATTQTITITVTNRNGETEDDDEETSVFVKHIQIPNAYEKLPGDDVELYISFENDGDESFDHVKVIATIPELSLRAQQGGSQRLYIGEERREVLFFNLPDYTPEGVYWVRIQIVADDVSRVIHREIQVGDTPDERPLVRLVI